MVNNGRLKLINNKWFVEWTYTGIEWVYKPHTVLIDLLIDNINPDKLVNGDEVVFEILLSDYDFETQSPKLIAKIKD